MSNHSSISVSSSTVNLYVSVCNALEEIRAMSLDKDIELTSIVESGIRLKRDARTYQIIKSELSVYFTQFIYGDGEYLTDIGKMVCRKVGTGDYSGHYEGEYDFSCGCPSYACPSYAYYYTVIREVTEEDIISVLLHYKEKVIFSALQKVEENNERIFSERKEFGAQKNAQLIACGFNKEEIAAWWNMQWKYETSAEKLREYVEKAKSDPKSFSLALAFFSRAKLEKLGWMIKTSVSINHDLLICISRITGIKPASDEDIKAFLKAFLKKPTKWVFGE